MILWAFCFVALAHAGFQDDLSLEHEVLYDNISAEMQFEMLQLSIERAPSTVVGGMQALPRRRTTTTTTRPRPQPWKRSGISQFHSELQVGPPGMGDLQ